jgi:ribosome maturation factor RimP
VSESTNQDWRVLVTQAIEPLLARQGYELVLLEYVPNGRVLRLYVDHPKGMTLDDCTSVSRTIGDMLDLEGHSDRIPGRFHLEVSSPGLDRPLVKPGHFQRFVGRKVRLTTKVPRDGRRNYQGILVAADEVEVRMDIDGESYALRYDMIAGARLVPEI